MDHDLSVEAARRIYGKRFSCEETFGDIKDVHCPGFSSGSRSGPWSGAWVLVGRGWGATFERSGVRVPLDNDVGPNIDGLRATTLDALPGGDRADRGLDG